MKNCAQMTLESACPAIGLDGWQSAPDFGAYSSGTLSSIRENFAQELTFKRFVVVFKIYLFYYFLIIK
jgi:hypothetical protein